LFNHDEELAAHWVALRYMLSVDVKQLIASAQYPVAFCFATDRLCSTFCDNDQNDREFFD
jgi:hypothetical protein